MREAWGTLRVASASEINSLAHPTGWQNFSDAIVRGAHPSKTAKGEAAEVGGWGKGRPAPRIYSFDTVLPPFATQMLAPSNATPNPPPEKVPRVAPSLARSLVTLPPRLATQMFAPSNATP
jgi:hypothetical protein